jgi:hypothetical protein
VAPGATYVHEADLDSPALSTVTMAYTATTTGGRNITADVAITLTSYAKRLSFSDRQQQHRIGGPGAPADRHRAGGCERQQGDRSSGSASKRFGMM